MFFVSRNIKIQSKKGIQMVNQPHNYNWSGEIPVWKNKHHKALGAFSVLLNPFVMNFESLKRSVNRIIIPEMVVDCVILHHQRVWEDKKKQARDTNNTKSGLMLTYVRQHEMEVNWVCIYFIFAYNYCLIFLYFRPWQDSVSLYCWDLCQGMGVLFARLLCGAIIKFPINVMRRFVFSSRPHPRRLNMKL